MDIRIIEFLDNIETQDEGITVVIDVYRAFTTALQAFSRGAKKIISVSKLDKAYELKLNNPSFILMGEREGLKQRSFDYGNSPVEIINADLLGKTVIHTSSAGTQGLVKAAQGKNEVITGSLANAFSVARYIRKNNYAKVRLVAMGRNGNQHAPEDMECANYIKDLLLGQAKCASHYNFRVRYFTQHEEADFINNGIWKPGDMDRCLSMNHFSYILKVKESAVDFAVLEKLTIF